ncbi:glycosyltransferase family 4 protein [Achromobacter xylosoxidans]|uniref:glycosyltransferase family 4 protein n=1 Tax=Alcaligenes xylosoxydans xylosoxydans TaxID=85698 RepID=UPI0015639B89|nr:glycosyltransferase family 4 protein [Achromobacter xylosoxidans]QKI70407.1 glycosyltransferase family 4 protein [Achromobacter xylosoxidans]
MKTVALLVLNPFTNDSRVLKEARSLKRAGYDPFVIALHEQGLAEHEIVHDITVQRVRLHSRNWPKLLPVQIFKYLEWLWRAFLLARKAAIVHCNDLPTLPVGAAARMLSRKRTRVVYDAHEFEINDVANEPRWKIRVKSLMERFWIRHVDATMTVSESIADEYVRMYGITKPALVLNCPPLAPLPEADIFRSTFGISHDAIIFLYQGGLAAGRGIEPIIEAFTKLPDTRRVVVFMGYGPMADSISQAASKSPNIYYHPAVSPDVLPAYTASADVGLCLIENLCLSYFYCLPNKLFEYLMAGLPVMVSDLQELRRFVENHSVGPVLPDGDVTSILEAISRLDETALAKYAVAARSARQLFHWQAQENVLLDVYARVSQVAP